MTSYPDLLIEPEGHRRVLLLSISGEEGPGERTALMDALAHALDQLERDGRGLPFGAVVELRDPVSGDREQAMNERNGLYIQCVDEMAGRGMTLLACIRYDESGAPDLPGVRFSTGGYLGGTFDDLTEAYRWLEARLSGRRTFTAM